MHSRYKGTLELIKDQANLLMKINEQILPMREMVRVSD
jgi:hypothetical protein